MHDRALVVRNEGQTVAVYERLEAVAEPVAGTARDLAGVRALDLLNCGVTGKAAEGVCRECAADICSVLARCKACRHELRVFALAADAACRGIAARDYLAEHGQIRHNIKVTLCAGECHTEAGDNLVEYHQCAVLVAQLTHALVVVMGNGAGAALGADRLDYNAGSAAAESVALEHVLQHLQIVRAHLLGVLEAAAGDAVGLEQVAGAGDLQAVDHLIGPAVICAAYLDDVLLSGGDTRDTLGCHNSLCAGAEHTEHLNIGHMLVYLACYQHLRLVQKSGYRAALVEKLYDLLAYGGVVAAENSRAACLQEVNILVAVLIVEICAVCLCHAHGEWLVEGEVVLHAAGDIFLALLKDSVRLLALLIVILENYVVVIIVIYLPDRLTGEVFQSCIDLIGVVPSAYAAINHFLLPP